MKTKLYPAKTRGTADYGWLKANYSFSFANYYNPERIQFGALRVLNDDTIDASRGFDMHHHNNMEIITIPLAGGLKHKDSMGNASVIKAGEIQVMSAGKGILHSEYNASDKDPAQILQIWVFPDKNNVEPRYDQKVIDMSKAKNSFHTIVSPVPSDDGVWIHQQAWFSISETDKDVSLNYHFKSQNSGVYLFVIEGEVKVGEQVLGRRDALGITETDSFELESLTQSKFLLMEVPRA